MKHELTPEVISQIVDFAKKYEPKGDLVGIPREVISKMLQRQYEQNGKWDVEVFEKGRMHDIHRGGFDWCEAIEGEDFWSETLSIKKFTPFFTRYPERFESEPQYRDSLGYPLEIGEDIYRSDKTGFIDFEDDVKDGVSGFTSFGGIKDGGYFTGAHWKYAVSVEAYQNNPTEVLEKLYELRKREGVNQPEPVKQEEKPTKPVYVTPCGTFTEGEEVETQSGKRIFYRYDERLSKPYLCVAEHHNEYFVNGDVFNVFQWISISKKPLPTIEEVANKSGITVEQLREVVKQGK